MKIREIMTVDVETLDPDASIEEAAQLMSDADVGIVPVLEHGRVAGLLTDRDIVIRAVAEGLDPSETTVGDIMTQEVIHCYEDQDVASVAELMGENQIRRAIVLTRDGVLSGIVSLADLVHETRDAAVIEEILEKVCRPAGEPPAYAVYAEGGDMRKDQSKGEGGGKLGALIKGELAAVETYRQALEKVEEDGGGAELRRIEYEHEEALSLLQEQMTRLGVEPPTDSGLWGTWAKAVEGGAKVFGNAAAIKALKEGEEHGIKDYEAALQDESVAPQIKELISTNLLPKTRAHVPVLDRFLGEGGSGRAE